METNQLRLWIHEIQRWNHAVLCSEQRVCVGTGHIWVGKSLLVEDCMIRGSLEAWVTLNANRPRQTQERALAGCEKWVSRPQHDRRRKKKKNYAEAIKWDSKHWNKENANDPCVFLWVCMCKNINVHGGGWVYMFICSILFQTCSHLFYYHIPIVHVIIIKNNTLEH